MKRGAAFLLLLLAALLTVPASPAQGAQEELTGRVVLTLPEKTTGDGTVRLKDGNVMTRVRVPARKSLLAELPAGTAGVYLSWYEVPVSAGIVQLDARGNPLRSTAPSGLLNEWLPLVPGAAAVRIDAGRELALSDLRAFSVSAAPGWLPLSQPAPEKAALMVVAAHAGDEQLDLGGALPRYAGERGLSCAVVFCSHKNRQAIQDSLYALGQSGVAGEPICLNLPDRTYVNAPDSELKKIWKESEAVAALARVIRRCRPEVLVTHAAVGEGNEGARLLASRIAQMAVERAAYAAFEPNAANGPWQVKKVYLHEPGENAVCLPMDAPIPRLGGKTASALAKSGYDAYSYTGVYHRDAAPDGVFTLAASTVGPDSGEGDLLEHIPAENLTTAGVVPSAVAAPAAPTPTPTPPPPVTARVQTQAIPGVPTPTPALWEECFRQPGEPEETVIADDETGYYEYRSDTLSVRIDRRKTNKPAVYHVAHIRMRDVDAFRPGFGHPREGGMTKQSAEGMARRYKAVLLITGDDLIHMEVELKGILLRAGRYYSGLQGEATMALYPGMDMKLYYPYETTYQALLDDGVENSYSFGPVLVDGGKVYKYAYKHRNRKRNPRIGVGMVAPGHFVAIAVDGRIAGYSVGMEMMEFAELFEKEGCQVAYNLDGGASEAMVFMGEYVSLRSEEHVRTMPDALMWGYSELVPGEDVPPVHSGVYQD